MLRAFLAALCLFTFPACGPTPTASPGPEKRPTIVPAETEKYAALLRPLLDPTQLATLGERGANPRLNKAMAILIEAKSKGQVPPAIISKALPPDWQNTNKGAATAVMLFRNLEALHKYGATTAEDLAALRRGNGATIRIGPHAGDVLSVNHVVPRAICPEADNIIANLQLMPLEDIRRKSDKVGQSELFHAATLYHAGLISESAFSRVKRAKEAGE